MPILLTLPQPPTTSLLLTLDVIQRTIPCQSVKMNHNVLILISPPSRRGVRRESRALGSIVRALKRPAPNPLYIFTFGPQFFTPLEPPPPEIPTVQGSWTEFMRTGSAAAAARSDAGLPVPVERCLRLRLCERSGVKR
jgi:hypothetical protein